MLEKTHIIYYQLCLWVEKKQRQKGDFLQPCFFPSLSRKRSSLYFGQFRPFHPPCAAPELKQLIESVFLKLQGCFDVSSMDKSGMHQNSVVSSHLQHILHETHLSLLIPAPKRHCCVSQVLAAATAFQSSLNPPSSHL